MDTTFSNEITQYREMIERIMSGLNTCIPGIIQSFDSSNQTCTVIPAIQKKKVTNGQITWLEYAPISNVPLVIPYGTSSGFCLTVPINSGDECLLLFSQEMLDNWQQSGGIQPGENTPGSRHHHLTDAIAIPAPISAPHAIASWQNDGIELRNSNRSVRIKAGTSGIELVSGNTIIAIDSIGNSSITTSETIVLNGNLTLNGNLQTNGNIGASGNIAAVGTVHGSNIP